MALSSEQRKESRALPPAKENLALEVVATDPAGGPAVMTVARLAAATRATRAWARQARRRPPRSRWHALDAAAGCALRAESAGGVDAQAEPVPASSARPENTSAPTSVARSGGERGSLRERGDWAGTTISFDWRGRSPFNRSAWRAARSGGPCVDEGWWRRACLRQRGGPMDVVAPARAQRAGRLIEPALGGGPARTPTGCHAADRRVASRDAARCRWRRAPRGSP